MQVLMNKYFLLNTEKIRAGPSCRFKKTHFNSEKLASPIRRLGYSNNQLN